MSSPLRVGIIGYGAFGQLTALALTPYFDGILISDTAKREVPLLLPSIRNVPLQEIAKCRYIILAVPVATIAEVCTQLAPYLHRKSIVLDVG